MGCITRNCTLPIKCNRCNHCRGHCRCKCQTAGCIRRLHCYTCFKCPHHCPCSDITRNLGSGLLESLRGDNGYANPVGIVERNHRNPFKDGIDLKIKGSELKLSSEGGTNMIVSKVSDIPIRHWSANSLGRSALQPQEWECRISMRLWELVASGKVTLVHPAVHAKTNKGNCMQTKVLWDVPILAPSNTNLEELTKGNFKGDVDHLTSENITQEVTIMIPILPRLEVSDKVAEAMEQAVDPRFVSEEVGHLMYARGAELEGIRTLESINFTKVRGVVIRMPEIAFESKTWDCVVLDEAMIQAHSDVGQKYVTAGLDSGAKFARGVRMRECEIGYVIYCRQEVEEQFLHNESIPHWFSTKINQATIAANLEKVKHMVTARQGRLDMDGLASMVTASRKELLTTLNDVETVIKFNYMTACYLPDCTKEQDGGLYAKELVWDDFHGVTVTGNSEIGYTSRSGMELHPIRIGNVGHIAKGSDRVGKRGEFTGVAFNLEVLKVNNDCFRALQSEDSC